MKTKKILTTVKTAVSILALTAALGLSFPSVAAPAVNDAQRLEPNEADLAKARAERAKKPKASADEVYVSERGTVIRKNVDQNNHVRSITVTPGETGIPYTMKNQSSRPIDNGASTNTRSTLGTPKFVELNW